MDTEAIIKEIVDSAYAVRRVLGTGYMETVYQHALAVELRLRGIGSVIEHPIEVRYKGFNVGHYRADLFVNDEIIVELKVAEELSPNHEFQLVNYLKSTGVENGILINFGPNRVNIRRKFRDYRT